LFYEQKLSPTASSLKNETNNHSCHSVYIFFLYYTKKQKKVNPIFQSFLKNGNHKKAVSDRNDYSKSACRKRSSKIKTLKLTKALQKLK